MTNTSRTPSPAQALAWACDAMAGTLRDAAGDRLTAVDDALVQSATDTLLDALVAFTQTHPVIGQPPEVAPRRRR